MAHESIKAQLLRIDETVKNHASQLSVLNHQHDQATNGLHTRLATLEKERVQLQHALRKLDASIEQLAAFAATLKDFKDLMAIWTRGQLDDLK